MKLPSYEDLIIENENLKKLINSLSTQIQELKNRSSKNSSQPPSKDWKGKKKPRENKGGAQKGHPAHQWKALENVDQTITCKAECCPKCEGRILNQRKGALKKQWIEFENRGVVVTEFIRPRHFCCGCKYLFYAPLPEGVSKSPYGPRLQSIVTLFTGKHHLGKKDIPELMKELYNLKMCNGVISKIEARMVPALEPAYEEMRKIIQLTKHVKYIDETTWFNFGSREWVWLASTSKYAFYMIHPSRGKKAKEELLGEQKNQPCVTDRYAAYNGLSKWHQFCLAHLMRNFKKWVEKEGIPGIVGENLHETLGEVFHLWHRYKEGEIDFNQLKR